MTEDQPEDQCLAVPAATPVDDFYIVDQQNEGVIVPLYRPDGSETEHSLTIIGHFSKAFSRAKRDVFATAQSDFRKIQNDPKARDAALEDRRLRLTAALVKDWTFPMPCDEENKVDFLRKAPQIAELIDQVAGDQVLFTKASLNKSK